MAGAVAIRRLRLAGLAPRDHPAPRDLEARLAESARTWLAPALAQRLDHRSDGAVVRVRRLAVDVTLDTGFDHEAFADLLAGAIAAGVERATKDSTADEDTVVVFASRADYIAALLEALAAGRATQRWHLREAAEGLRFLASSAAMRTALLAEPADGEAALLSLSPGRLASLLSALGTRESERVLDAFAAASSAAVGPEAAVAAVVAAAEGDGSAASEPLALYLRARAAGAVGGSILAAVARLWVNLAGAVDRPYETSARAWLDWLAGEPADQSGSHPDPIGLIVSEAARLALAASLARRRANRTPGPRYGDTGQPRGSPTFTRFAGLLLLVPGLEIDAIAQRVAEWPDAPQADTAALIAYASVGLCAGRRRLAAWLQESLWRELFGLDHRPTAAELAERLAAISEAQWRTLAPLGLRLESPRNARFLLAPRALVRASTGAPAAASVRGLAALAHALAFRFGRRLNGLREPSAPFLWENLLGAGGVLEPVEGGWQARLSRPPLDVLLSLSRLAEGSLRLPGGDVRISRVAA
jgi:hypothetical protein